MLLRRVTDVFGPAALGHAIFYQHKPALRLELSGGETRLDQFSQAYDRARTVTSRAFDHSDRLTVILAAYMGNEKPATGTLLRHARSCGVEVPRQRESVIWPAPTEGEPARSLVAFHMGREALPLLLWGVIAQELGVRPRLAGELYLADPDQGVLVHPYDDRGMDVIGPNVDLLAALFREFQTWLLVSDYPQMHTYFR